ncbi:acetyl-coenzyme A synthetase N-terminal domain-containing protein, partial [Cupriavidus taiwanensis]
MKLLESVMPAQQAILPARAPARPAAVPSMEAYQALCDEAERDYEGFWARHARELLHWNKPFTKVLDESNAPFYKWFEDGQLNASYNCLDRNLENGNADKVAIVFEADDGTVTRITYRELHAKVCRLANGLKTLGIKKGDRVVIYMPMSVEGVA